MTPTVNCRRLVMHFEGLRLQPYRCPAGVPTIGYGHTKGVTMRSPAITNEQAESLLDADLQQFAAEVEPLLSHPIAQQQFDAVVSFAYNVGIAALRASTLLRHLNKRAYSYAADEFLKWCKAGGQTVPGLLRRRRAEQHLFRNGCLPADLGEQ